VSGFDAVLNWLGKHISWRYLVGIVAASGTLLFFCDRLSACSWADPLRGLLWASFIFSGSVLLTYPGSGIYKWIADYARDTRVMHVGKKHLHKLTAGEKPHCKHFIDTDGDQMRHNPLDGNITSLVRKGVLIPGGVWPNGVCNYTMQPWALEYLKKHPELVK
jgi:hypothetical protein